MSNFTYHINMFNDRVRSMNQNKKTELRLTSVEANDLLADIVTLLAQVSSLESRLSAAENSTVEVSMDGGSFK